MQHISFSGSLGQDESSSASSRPSSSKGQDEDEIISNFDDEDRMSGPQILGRGRVILKFLKTAT